MELLRSWLGLYCAQCVANSSSVPLLCNSGQKPKKKGSSDSFFFAKNLLVYMPSIGEIRYNPLTMNFRKNRFIHWIAALAIAMSALAPTVSQAVSLAKHGQGFAMEICSADGNKMQINVHGDEQEVADQAQPCPYCVAQSAITPAFNTNLTFEAPQSLTLLPALFYQSPKPLAAWETPPSAAPPTQA